VTPRNWLTRGKLLRAIRRKAGDVKTLALCLRLEGVIVDVKIFSRKGVDKDERAKTIESEDIHRLQRVHQDEIRILEEETIKKIRRYLVGKSVAKDLVDRESGEVILKKKKTITKEVLIPGRRRLRNTC
jgi:DNA-directed RNA polymerase subunit beta